MESGDLEFLAALVNCRTGIELRAEKRHSIVSRLNPVANRFGFPGVKSLLAELHRAPEAVLASLIEALLIRDTAFFRDPTTLTQFQADVLPALSRLRASEHRLRIWCAGASSGQECYSLAMLVDESGLPAQGWTVELIGTDISAEAISLAQGARYSRQEVRGGVSFERLLSYFILDNREWHVCAKLKGMAQFRVANLIGALEPPGPFDAIFCRNVLIHFDPRTRLDVLRKLENALAPGGYLVLGSKEAPFGLGNGLWRAGGAPIYVKRASGVRTFALAS